MTIVSCIVIMIGLTAFINRTKAGQAMLAVSEDRGAATLMGVNVNGTIALTFAPGTEMEVCRIFFAYKYQFYGNLLTKS